MSKYLKLLPMIMTVVVALFVTSCSKENELLNSDSDTSANPRSGVVVDSLDDDYDDEYEDIELGDFADCFDLVFPVTLVLGDNTATVSDYDQLEDQIDTWFDQLDSTQTEAYPTFQFPISLRDEDGSTTVVNSEDELEDLIVDCLEEEYGDDDYGDHDGDCGDMEFDECFEIVFPVNVVLGEQVLASVNSYDQLDDVMDDWFEENEDSIDSTDWDNDAAYPMLGFPFDVVLTENDSTVTVNNIEELEEIAMSCYDFEGGHDGPGHGGYHELCFELQYPIGYTFPNGTQATYDSRQEARQAIREWRHENHGEYQGQRPQKVFPITIVYHEDGSTVVINSREELRAVKEDCED